MACRDLAAKVGGGVLGRVWALVAALALLLGLAAFAPAPAQAASFRDVPSGQWYTSWVDKASDQGLMSGFTDPATGRPTGYFGPDEPLTRAQVATVLWRMAGGPSSGHASFPDVERGSWYDAPVAWCVKAGVVTGYTSGPDRGCFRPDRPVTRQELATMVYRYAKYAGMDVADPDPTAFRSTTDWRTADSWASEALTWTAAAGVLSGVDNHDGTYSVVPFGTATRAMAAKVFVVLSGSPSAAKASYTVTFNSNGGSAVKAQTVKNGAKASKPADPTKSGYLFKGWYSDKSLTKAFNFNSTVRSNLTLYAKWEKKAAYTVTFDSNGGSAVKAQSVSSGARASKPADPTRAGHAFKGWYSDKSLTKAYDFSLPVKSNLALYAKWEAKAAYTVTFNANGGTAVKAQSVSSGAKASKPADPTKAGHVFKGWYSDKSLTKAYDFNSAVKSNLTLYAKWEREVTHTVTFDPNGGSAVEAQTVRSGAKASRPADPAKSGFVFAGWYTDAALTEAYDFDSAVKSDLTLYAKWETQPYAILYGDGLLSLQAGDDTDPSHGGVLGKWAWDGSSCPWYDKCFRVRSVVARDGIAVSYGWALFLNFSNCLSMDLSKLDVSGASCPYDMFYNCSSLASLDISGWDVSSAKQLSGMFYGCSSLTSLDVVSGWDVSNASYLDAMFGGCSSLESLDLSGWDVSNASDLRNMFRDCSFLETLDLSGWDVSNASKLHNMFSGCSSLTSLDLSGWDVSGASDLSEMFSGCSSLASLDLSGWDVSNASDLSGMFSGCSSLSTVTLGVGCGSLVGELPRGPWYDAEGNEYDLPPAGVAGTFTKTKPAVLAAAAEAVSDADALLPAQIVEGEQDGLRYVVVPEGASFEYGIEYPELAGRYVGLGVYVTGYAGESDSPVVPLEVADVPVVSANLSWNESDRSGMTRLSSVSFERAEGKASSLVQLDVSGNLISALDIEGLDALVRLNCEGNPIADLAALQAWAAVEGHEARLPQVQEAAPTQPAAGDNAQAPSEPQEPVSPDVPTKPAEPANPEAPSTEPGEPSVPATPAEPEQPGNSDVSGEPDQPGDDSVGSDMSESEEPKALANTAGLGETGQDGDASATEEQVAAIQPAELKEESFALAA